VAILPVAKVALDALIVNAPPLIVVPPAPLTVTVPLPVAVRFAAVVVATLKFAPPTWE
jgi:Mrp family chromosome partitioning ATPase